MPAADFPDFLPAKIDVLGQLAHDLKTPLDPEIIHGGDIEPRVRHVDGGAIGQVNHFIHKLVSCAGCFKN